MKDAPDEVDVAVDMTSEPGVILVNGKSTDEFGNKWVLLQDGQSVDSVYSFEQFQPSSSLSSSEGDGAAATTTTTTPVDVAESTTTSTTIFDPTYYTVRNW